MFQLQIFAIKMASETPFTPGITVRPCVSMLSPDKAGVRAAEHVAIRLACRHLEEVWFTWDRISARCKCRRYSLATFLKDGFAVFQVCLKTVDVKLICSLCFPGVETKNPLTLEDTLLMCLTQALASDKWFNTFLHQTLRWKRIKKGSLNGQCDQEEGLHCKYCFSVSETLRRKSVQQVDRQITQLHLFLLSQANLDKTLHCFPRTVLVTCVWKSDRNTCTIEMRRTVISTRCKNRSLTYYRDSVSWYMWSEMLP